MFVMLLTALAASDAMSYPTLDVSPTTKHSKKNKGKHRHTYRQMSRPLR